MRKSCIPYSNPQKSVGPDNIPACFLKNTANEIAPMLTHLFQLSLRTGVLPSVWTKQAFITPIYKAGEKTDPHNYHPISLTSITCKIMEHIICSHLMHHLDTHNILYLTLSLDLDPTTLVNHSYS